jgi:hypothetical protein
VSAVNDAKELLIDEKAFRKVTGQWLTARDIWAVVGEGTPEAVGAALWRLWEAGRVHRTDEKPPRYMRVIMVG